MLVHNLSSFTFIILQILFEICSLNKQFQQNNLIKLLNSLQTSACGYDLAHVVMI